MVKTKIWNSISCHLILYTAVTWHHISQWSICMICLEECRGSSTVTFYWTVRVVEREFIIPVYPALEDYSEYSLLWNHFLTHQNIIVNALSMNHMKPLFDRYKNIIVNTLWIKWNDFLTHTRILQWMLSLRITWNHMRPLCDTHPNIIVNTLYKSCETTFSHTRILYWIPFMNHTKPISYASEYYSESLYESRETTFWHTPKYYSECSLQIMWNPLPHTYQLLYIGE